MQRSRAAQPSISRRDLLRGAALAGAVGVLGATVHAGAAAAPGQTAVVVGSGFGGAVAALRLGQAGYRTIVFERGRRWPIRSDGDTFATFVQPDRRAA
ncbi:MAG: NAD(P)-binding protein, partial [Actinomycetota bacterium]|nr:NAD(P)-binding protein [Actinomycetota bacterium]